jgi:hypothetical protein
MANATAQEARMGSLNFTTVLWLIGPATLSAGQSVEYAIIYPGGGSVTSFNAIDTLTAMNERFSYETTGIVIHGASEDAPRVVHDVGGPRLERIAR